MSKTDTINERLKVSIVENLRKLADNIEKGKVYVLELSVKEHYDAVLISESELFRHNFTGDDMIQIRFKSQKLTVIE